MTIYRGPGGGGNADSDAEINALTALTNQALAYSEAAELEADAAAASAAAASTSAASAATSASGAATSATNAASSASSASTSASSASTNATNAAASASSASTSATNAASSASVASTSATNAAASETNAATSASSASTYATASAASAVTASTQASNAATSATAAAGSATTASTQASNAATSASGAATSATNASNSASAASTSAANALASETAAAASVASIDLPTIVRTTGNQTIEGIKTFSSTIVGSISGNSATATTATNQSGGTVSATSIAYSTTLTGGTGVVNLGSGQVYKDASGNVGIGTSSPSGKLDVKTATDSKITFNDGSTTGNVRMEAVNAAYSAYKPLELNGSVQIFATGATERARIDSSGNVGIGITNPSANGSLAVLSPAGGIAYGLKGRSADGYGRFQAWDRSGTVPTGSLAFSEDGTIAFNRGNTGTLVENARIDSSGNVLVGRTSTGGTAAVSVERPANTATYIYQMKSGQVECTWGFKASTDTNMYIGSGSTAVGTNGVYLTNTGNSWNAVSDERMKIIVEPIANAADKVATLRAVIGYYNHDENQIRRPFLIAQDVQAVLPEAVNIQDPETGTLGMSYTDTIPLLVAAIKEQQTTIVSLQDTLTALTARITALETA